MARPTTRRGLPSAAPVTPAPLIRNYSGGRAAPVRVEFDARTVYDFVFSLSEDAGVTDDLPSADRRWLTDARESMRTMFGDSLNVFGGQLCVVLAGLVVDRPEIRDAAAFVDLVTSLDDATVIRAILGEDLRDPTWAPVVERALAGDEEAIEQLVQRQADSPPEERHDPLSKPWIIQALFHRPESVLGPTRGILAAWLEPFSSVEERVLAMLERDVALRAEDRRSLAAPELVERTTGGVRFTGEPGVTRVILAPSYFSRPYNYLLAAGDWRLFGYPIADAALDASDPFAPPQSVLRFHRALGDDTRLRILRLLRERDLYLTEIAQLMELSKPTIKHHLAQLRAAGVVTVTDAGGLTYYSLRRDRLERACVELRDYLLD